MGSHWKVLTKLPKKGHFSPRSLELRKRLAFEAQEMVQDGKMACYNMGHPEWIFCAESESTIFSGKFPREV
jgi:hypothetical protein